MKIAIVGAGKLGTKLAETLLGGEYSVTIIDYNEAHIEKINTLLDVMTVTANAKEKKVLNQINISTYDYLIATTGSDETNIVVCAFAKALGCKQVIARIRDPEHMSQIDFIKSVMNIDLIVNPDQTITREIYKYLAEKYTLGNGIFTMGQASLLEFNVSKYPELIDSQISDVSKFMPEMLFVALSRNGRVIIPHGDTVISRSDIVYVIGPKGRIQKLSEKVHEKGIYTDLQKVMIIGGGKTGFFLAQKLSDFGASVKVIEQDKDRCHYLSTHLNNVMVLHGDATDLTLLEEENLDGMDAFVTATGFDEDNLLLALTAKNHGIEDVIAKVSRSSYADIISSMGVDMVLNPLNITTNEIIRFVRSTKTVISSQLIQGQAELMEVIASSHMQITDTPIKDLNLPQGFLIAAIHRGGELIIPTGTTVIKEDDKVIIVSLIDDLKVTEKLFTRSHLFPFFKK
ncbi:MAG: Trk system potassium transporter TrkA [Bacillota bacterium]|nr:Trk system potassium transporter TrkA [Bacillota bacterium]